MVVVCRGDGGAWPVDTGTWSCFHVSCFTAAGGEVRGGESSWEARVVFGGSRRELGDRANAGEGGGTSPDEGCWARMRMGTDQASIRGGGRWGTWCTPLHLPAHGCCEGLSLRRGRHRCLGSLKAAALLLPANTLALRLPLPPRQAGVVSAGHRCALKSVKECG